MWDELPLSLASDTDYLLGLDIEEKEMNWLIYIGGGIVFFGLGICFMKGLVKTDPEGWFQLLFITIPPILIWVWICWRFIR